MQNPRGFAKIRPYLLTSQVVKFREIHKFVLRHLYEQSLNAKTNSVTLRNLFLRCNCCAQYIYVSLYISTRATWTTVWHDWSILNAPYTSNLGGQIGTLDDKKYVLSTPSIKSRVLQKFEMRVTNARTLACHRQQLLLTGHLLYCGWPDWWLLSQGCGIEVLLSPQAQNYLIG